MTVRIEDKVFQDRCHKPATRPPFRDERYQSLGWRNTKDSREQKGPWPQRWQNFATISCIGRCLTTAPDPQSSM
jgi:hypothetical protein